MKRTLTPLLVVMARPPGAANCKTRLVADVGQAQARRVYELCLRQVLRACGECDGQLRVTVAGAPLSLADHARSVSRDVELVRQRGADLGERSSHEVARGLADGYCPIVVVASDLWGLTAGQVRWAARQSAEGRVAVVPSPDGGYGVLGTAEPLPELAQIVMSGTSTLSHLCSALSGSGKRAVLCRTPVADIDTGRDLIELGL
jgi:glycosyltransferase A (GT-A) superfamily protein (DUF2064 family)